MNETLVSLELVSGLAVRQVGHVDDACHAVPPAASGMGASRNGVTVEASTGE